MGMIPTKLLVVYDLIKNVKKYPFFPLTFLIQSLQFKTSMYVACVCFRKECLLSAFK